MYESTHAQVVEKKENIKSTLTTAEQSSDMIESLKKRLQHEKMVLEQKHQGSNSLLTQIGQDRAITEEHVRMVQKTRNKIQHLEKVNL